jgi:hypothetical protein
MWKAVRQALTTSGTLGLDVQRAASIVNALELVLGALQRPMQARQPAAGSGSAQKRCAGRARRTPARCPLLAPPPPPPGRALSAERAAPAPAPAIMCDRRRAQCEDDMRKVLLLKQCLQVRGGVGRGERRSAACVPGPGRPCTACTAAQGLMQLRRAPRGRGRAPLPADPPPARCTGAGVERGAGRGQRQPQRPPRLALGLGGRAGRAARRLPRPLHLPGHHGGAAGRARLPLPDVQGARRRRAARACCCRLPAAAGCRLQLAAAPQRGQPPAARVLSPRHHPSTNPSTPPRPATTRRTRCWSCSPLARPPRWRTSCRCTSTTCWTRATWRRPAPSPRRCACPRSRWRCGTASCCWTGHSRAPARTPAWRRRARCWRSTQVRAEPSGKPGLLRGPALLCAAWPGRSPATCQRSRQLLTECQPLTASPRAGPATPFRFVEVLAALGRPQAALAVFRASARAGEGGLSLGQASSLLDVRLRWALGRRWGGCGGCWVRCTGATGGGLSIGCSLLLSTPMPMPPPLPLQVRAAARGAGGHQLALLGAGWPGGGAPLQGGLAGCWAGCSRPRRSSRRHPPRAACCGAGASSRMHRELTAGAPATPAGAGAAAGRVGRRQQQRGGALAAAAAGPAAGRGPGGGAGGGAAGEAGRRRAPPGAGAAPLLCAARQAGGGAVALHQVGSGGGDRAAALALWRAAQEGLAAARWPPEPRADAARRAPLAPQVAGQ